MSYTYIARADLVELYKSGRMKKEPTMKIHDLGQGFADLGGSRQNPVEAMIADAQNTPLGAVWLADIDSLLLIAEFEGDTERQNPNLGVVQNILLQMAEMRVRLGHEGKSPIALQSEFGKTCLSGAVDTVSIMQDHTAEIIPLMYPGR